MEGISVSSTTFSSLLTSAIDDFLSLIYHDTPIGSLCFFSTSHSRNLHKTSSILEEAIFRVFELDGPIFSIVFTFLNLQHKADSRR